MIKEAASFPEDPAACEGGIGVGDLVEAERPAMASALESDGIVRCVSRSKDGMQRGIGGGSAIIGLSSARGVVAPAASALGWKPVMVEIMKQGKHGMQDKGKPKPKSMGDIVKSIIG